MLKKENIIHNVLNAKNHAREAEIVANAGQAGAVTIATNMAGRGTDIKLGSEVVHLNKEDLLSTSLALDSKIEGKTLSKILQDKPCGLYVIASERHESRRIDRQLRGRSARQGDPGVTRFYVSLEDNLMRLFGSEKISGIMEKLGIEEGEVLEHPWLNRSIETAQRRVEQQNFMMRKRTLEYDDVMNAQRSEIYDFRSDVLKSENPRKQLIDSVEQAVQLHAEIINDLTQENKMEFINWVNTTFPLGFTEDDISDEDTPKTVTQKVMEQIKQAYTVKASHESEDSLKRLERHLILQSIDQHWQEYLRSMDSLRESIGLRAYGQRDPLVEYKREAYIIFLWILWNAYTMRLLPVFSALQHRLMLCKTSLSHYLTFKSQNQNHL